MAIVGSEDWMSLLAKPANSHFARQAKYFDADSLTSAWEWLRGKGAKMTVYLEVAQTLVTAGYLSDEDVGAAAAVLVNTMKIADVKHQESMAIDDMLSQQGVITEAEVEASAAAEMGDDSGQAHHADIIERAEKAEIQDRETITAAQDAIASASRDAAAALVAAGLVDAACHQRVVDVIGHARW